MCLMIGITGWGGAWQNRRVRFEVRLVVRLKGVRLQYQICEEQILFPTNEAWVIETSLLTNLTAKT